MMVNHNSLSQIVKKILFSLLVCSNDKKKPIKIRK